MTKNTLPSRAAENTALKYLLNEHDRVFSSLQKILDEISQQDSSLAASLALANAERLRALHSADALTPLKNNTKTKEKFNFRNKKKDVMRREVLILKLLNSEIPRETSDLITSLEIDSITLTGNLHRLLKLEVLQKEYKGMWMLGPRAEEYKQALHQALQNFPAPTPSDTQR